MDFINLVSLITVVTFLNSLIGCSYTANISIDEMRDHPRETITGIVFFDMIEGIILHSGDEILFNEQGGLFDKNTRMISGINSNGAAVEVGLDEIDYVLIKRTTIDGTEEIMANVYSFEYDAGKREWKEYDGSELRVGEIVSVRAKYDTTAHVIKGVTETGRNIQIEPEYILNVQVKRISIWSILGGVATFIMILYIAGLATYASQ